MILVLVLVLILDMVPCIGVILLGVNVVGGKLEALYIAVYGLVPVLLGNGDVSAVVEKRRSKVIPKHAVFGNGIHLLCGFVHIALPVQVVCKVVSACNAGAVFNEALAVTDVGLVKFAGAEFAVSAPEIASLAPCAYAEQRQ